MSPPKWCSWAVAWRHCGQFVDAVGRAAGHGGTHDATPLLWVPLAVPVRLVPGCPGFLVLGLRVPAGRSSTEATTRDAGAAVEVGHRQRTLPESRSPSLT